MMTITDPICPFCAGETNRGSYYALCTHCGIELAFLHRNPYGPNNFGGDSFLTISYNPYIRLIWSDEKEMKLYAQSLRCLVIPFFDPFLLSLDKLKEKLRLYILFS